MTASSEPSVPQYPDDDASRGALEEAVARVGDRWSLLVVDALLGGPRRFGDLSDRVRGVSPNVLSKRLRDLETAGVVVAEPYSQRPLRHDYRLTPLGRDLAAALAALAAWGERATEATESAVAPRSPSHAPVFDLDLDVGPGGDGDEDIHYA